MSNNSNLFLSIGKPIKDEYGRTVGRVASFALTPSGKFDGVFIESHDGKFSKQPMEYLQFNGAEVTIISTLKSQASVLCNQIPLIWRKDQALKDLAEKRKISPDLYQELHKNFEGVLNQLKKDAQALSDEAGTEMARCDQEIKTLGYAVVNLELEHEVGQIEEEAYKSAFAMLQEYLKRANLEKGDIELTKNQLSNILLGDSKQPEQKTNTPSTESTDKKPQTKETPNETTKETSKEAPELPEPPVVVYVKEVGKAGI
ncbi:MAG: CdvA-like protein [Candidatus Bathyarchaeota archaeon]|nr:MAG: CdvA-like protein [Candidatus Bathyarchaeota archaeon]